MKTTWTVNSRLRALSCLTGLLGLFFVSPKARADEGDPPSRVARVSFLDGTVSLQPGGTGDWGAAAKNRTVTVGDKIWSDKDSRAELQAGEASIHIGSMTALSFLNLDENITQMRLAEGAVNFRVRELREGDLYEVDTPNLAFTVKQAGAFRIDVTENGDATRVTALRGEGEVTAGGQTYTVHAGERADFNGTDAVQYNVSSAPEPDGLDRWANQRDLKEDNSTSARYVSRDVPGYSDLDDNGTWSEQPDYGPVWYPNTVSAGWAPYSNGYWNWVGPWGWTWVDYAPWGFAPFHYGRWSFIGNRWGWCPGSIFDRPVFGPAFVGFYGGSHFGAGFGFGFGGGVGWFPLGFGEPFFPWFRCGRGFRERINVRNTFIRNVNIVHAGNVRNFNFVNARNVNAVTVASRSAFVNGQAINRSATRVTAASLRGAQVTNNVGFSPNRQSAIGAANARAHVGMPPSSVQNRSVMARTTPAAAASHMPVRTINPNGITAARMGNTMSNRAGVRTTERPGNGTVNSQRGVAANAQAGADRSSATLHGNSGISSRQRELSSNRPPSANGAIINRAINDGAINRGATNNRASANFGTNNNRPSTGTRTWEAQGNATDRGRAPQGTRTNRSDRPSWAGSGSNGSTNGGGSRSSAPAYNSNRPSPSNGNRSYEPPSRSNSAPSRSYSSPRSSYPAAPRSYSAPSRSYSAPSRSYSAPPSRSYSAPRSSGGGGGSRSGGGGGSRGGGSVSHGGGNRH
jgi:hypothetical protein